MIQAEKKTVYEGEFSENGGAVYIIHLEDERGPGCEGFAWMVLYYNSIKRVSVERCGMEPTLEAAKAVVSEIRRASIK